jgi:hypothetical protein
VVNIQMKVFWDAALFNSVSWHEIHDVISQKTVVFALLLSTSTHGLRSRSAAARLSGLRVRILPGVRISVSCTCYVFSDRSLCDWLIPRPEESY